ncbi:MAG: DNA topoisomerase 3 [Prevotellaceae bacterium]|nr:DNA topoisomerase 3 [Prevotellaceae bacterium]
MIVCIAEKPSVAASIAKVLGASTRKNGYFEGHGYQVTWAFGHLCGIKEPKEQNPAWGPWQLSLLPMIPKQYKIGVYPEKSIRTQFGIIKKLYHDASEIVNCGDAGQEGEVIQRYIMELAGVRCPVKRLWISSLTEESIREGFAHLHEQSEYDSLYEAGLARSRGDWLLGMNCTRLYTCKFGGGSVLSIGRVQTPTLAMIVSRDREISDFKPSPYWTLQTVFKGATFTSDHGRITDKRKAQELLESVKGTTFAITHVEQKKGQELPPQLYDLTALQVDCNKKFGFSADTTLKTLQSLYEKKLTTYPRVDTRYLTHDIYDKCPGILRTLTDITPLVTELAPRPLTKSPRVFNDNKVTDHHALMPTGEKAGTLTEFERKVYALVCKRFISVFMPPCVYAQTVVQGTAGNEKFKVTGKTILDAGWKKLLGADADDDGEKNKTLPVFHEGEEGSHTPSLLRKMTTPPKPYTEASLLQAMETAGKFVEDEALRDALKENGIGRPATRAAIIETLLKRKYIVRDRKNLVSTATGRQLIDTIKDKMLISPETTGQWERKLRMIEKKQFTLSRFMEELGEQVTRICAEVKGDTTGTTIGAASVNKNAVPDERMMTPYRRSLPGAKLLNTTCPVCGIGTVKRGRYSYFCTNHNNGCNFKKPLD